MSLLPYLDFYPEIGQRVFIAEGARVIGRAKLGDHSSIWFNSVVRADVNQIIIGNNTNVQDMCMFHVTEFNDVVIGENTSFGHSVVLHGCKIGNGCLIGMGAIILDGAEIGDHCLVAAGSLVSPGKKFPAGSLIKGRPAVVERPLTPEEIERVSNHYKSYLGYKEQYLGMEESSEKKKGLAADLRVFLKRVNQHNLLLLASSIAYYSSLALAPILLILLSLASLIGEDVRILIMKQVALIAPELTGIFQIVFNNLQSRVDLGSVSGIFGVVFLVFLSSFVFLQLRHSLDVIYGDFDPHKTKSFWQILRERGLFMLIVLLMCSLLVISLLINPVFDYVLASRFQSMEVKRFVQVFLNFSILFVMFTGLYFFTPSKRKRLPDCAQTAILTSAAFLGGNLVTGFYMKKVALDSLYGATGAMLIFLLWTFYSALSVFASVEFFEFLKRKSR